MGEYITITKNVEIDVDVDDVLDEVEDEELKQILKSRDIDIDSNWDYNSLPEMSNTLIEFLKTKYKIWNQEDVLNAVNDLLSMSTLPKN